MSPKSDSGRGRKRLALTPAELAEKPRSAAERKDARRAAKTASRRRDARRAVALVKQRLFSGGPLSFSAVRAVYDELFDDTSRYSYLGVKEHPKFSVRDYPRIPAGFIPAGVRFPDLTTAESVLKAVEDESPIAKVLALFIWKQGDLRKVHHVVAGLRAAASEDDEDPESAAVMFQFGRHLSDPSGSPIFDRHTHRAFCCIADEAASSQRGPEELRAYLAWWQRNVHARANGDMDTLYWMDVLLFSTGKLASGLTVEDVTGPE